MTATLGDAKVSADAEVKDSYVAEIKITSKEALTAEGNPVTASGSAITETEKLAYIYYDVLNQYGESIRNSTTINWTTSVGNDTKKVDKSLGKITVSNGTTSFTYGSLIYVTGVHVGTGTTISESIPVGMAQAVNSIEFAGFINKNDSTKLVDSLPTNFAKNTYVLAYRTFDQNGNPLTVKGTEIADGDLTFIGDNVLLIDSSIKDAGTTYTIDGVEYSAVTIEPGDYVGRGGEVNITAIANKTGQKTTKNFVVGAAGQLKSLSLSTPANVVADGDQGVKLPYVAKDIDGNSITNYETIVRSSNTLTLTCTEGDLQVKEENDGTAGIYWSDATAKATVFDSSSVDNVDRSVSIGTIVVGGESNILVLPVSDARRPVAVKSIKLNNDDNNAIVDRATADVDILNKDDIVYLDQYGAELTGDAGMAIAGAYFRATINGHKYGVKVKTDGNKDIVGLADSVYDATNNTIAFTANSSTVKSTTVRFSVASATASSSRTDYNAWDNVDSEKNIAYTVVPFTELTNHSISSISKQEIVTNNSERANGTTITTEAVSGSALEADAEGTLTVVSNQVRVNGPESNAFSVTGEYSGKTITIPDSYYVAATGSAFAIDGSELTGVVPGELKWNELYDENTARLTRIDAVKKLVLTIDNGTATTDDDVTLTRNVTVSDAKAAAAEVKFLVDWWNMEAKEITIQPNNMEIAHFETDWGGHGFGSMALQIVVFDQYGKLYKNDDLGFTGVDSGKFTELTVSDIKENTGDFAHKPSSIKVVQNGSTLDTLKVIGAELGDTFTLKATIPGSNISNSISIKVGADEKANIRAGVGGTFDDDKTFRTDKLGYKK